MFHCQCDLKTQKKCRNKLKLSSGTLMFRLKEFFLVFPNRFDQWTLSIEESTNIFVQLSLVITFNAIILKQKSWNKMWQLAPVYPILWIFLQSHQFFFANLLKWFGKLISAILFRTFRIFAILFRTFRIFRQFMHRHAYYAFQC